MLEDSDGKRFMFEVYSENDGPVKGCKTDSKGTVVQGKHKTYRFVYFFKLFVYIFIEFVYVYIEFVYIFNEFVYIFIEFVYILYLYRMAANSQEDRTHWVSAIEDSIQVDPAYDIVRQKKAALRRKSIRFVYIFDLTSFF